MASGVYTAARQAFLGGDIDLINDSIIALLLTTSEYTVDLETHESQADVPDVAVLSISTLTGKTLVGGVFRADDTIFQSVTGDTVDAVILCVNGTTLSNSTLIAYLDNAPELPAALDGEDVTIVWDTGVNGIFRLT